MMRKYIGTKLVEAAPQERTIITAGVRTIVAPEGVETPTEDWLTINGLNSEKITVQTSVPGYKVRYPDGYESWSPKNVFDEAYHDISANMSFGDALVSMRQGFMCARALWLGKVVALRKGYANITFNADTHEAFHMSATARGHVQPYLQVKVGDILQVYIPTMDDLMAQDWKVIIEND